MGWVVVGAPLALVTDGAGAALAFAALIWGTLGLNYAVKRLVRRERPALDGAVPPLIEAPASPSFPSSHAAMSAAAAFGLSALVPGLWPLFATLALLMALSRIYLAVHHTPDVLAGLALGSVTGATYLALVA